MLTLIKDEAVRQRYDVVFVPGQKPGATMERIAEFRTCDVVVVQIGSLQPEQEIRLIEALDGIPIILVEDVPGVALRPKAKHIAGQIAAVFTAMPLDNLGWQKHYDDFGYGGRTHYIGPPPHWGPSYELMLGSKLRLNLVKVRDGGIETDLDTDDVLVFMGGNKTPAYNNAALRSLKAGTLKAVGDRAVICFKEHPGERPRNPGENAPDADRAKYVAMKATYDAMLEERHQLLQDVWVCKPGMASMPELIRVADVSILTGGQTDSIPAVYARLVSVTLMTPDMVTTLQELGLPNGEWPTSKVGASHEIKGPLQIADAISYVLSPEGKAALRTAQEEHFPIPTTWNTAPAIVEFLESL